MKALKIIVSAAGTLLLAGCIFFCLVSGAPETQELLEGYIFHAAGFSLILSVFLCACIHYILYLQKRVEELEKELIH